MLRDPTALYRISGRRLEQSVRFVFNMTAVGDEHGTGAVFFELHHQKRFNLALFLIDTF